MAQASFKIDPLTRKNYETWSMLVEAIMRKNGTWEHVQGTSTKPEVGEDRASQVQLAAWEKKESDAWSDLVVAIGPEELPVVTGIKTPRAMWLKLKSEFASSGPVKKASLLKRLVAHRLHDGDNLETHLKEFFDCLKKLKAMLIDVHPDLATVELLLS